MASRLGRRAALADHLALAARHPAGVRDRAFRLRDAHVHGDDIHGKLADEAGADATGIDLLPFPDLDQSVRDSVERVRSSDLLPESFSVSGYVYDCSTGAPERCRSYSTASWRAATASQLTTFHHASR
jgi:hypothetical protein